MINRKPNGKWNFYCPRCGHTETNFKNESRAKSYQAAHNEKGCDPK